MVVPSSASQNGPFSDAPQGDGALHVLMTDPHLRGGGQLTYVLRLAGEFLRLGHRVSIGCKAGSALASRAADLGCHVHDCFIFKGGMRPRAWFHDVLEARRVILGKSPDIIHVSGSQDHWVFAVANRLMGRPVCLVRTRHNTYPVKNNLPNRILNRAWTDFQIVVCETVRETLAAHPAFDAARMCAIHNGVDAEQYLPDPSARARARAEFGFADSDVVCGSAARLTPAKGHAFLLEAAAAIREQFPNMRLLLLGQGELEEALRRQAADLNIADIVRFAGYRQDMQYCTQAFDIGVLPSIDCDTSSFSLKEEMAAEKPIIASDYGGLKEIIDDGVEGLIVPAGTVAPLAEALGRLIGNPALRAAMGKRGRERVLAEFSMQTFAAKTLDAYRRAMEIHRERTASR